MAFARKPYKKFAKKTYKRVRKSYSSKYRANRYTKQTSGFPEKQIVKLRYCTNVNLNSIINNDVVFYQFNTNSIYDPDYTAGGHQPYGHDQWSPIYNHYQVLSCKLTCNSTMPANASGQGMMVGCIQSSSALVPTNLSLLQEIPNSRFKPLVAQKPTVFKSTWKAKKVFPASSPEQTANFGSNPIEDYLFTIIGFNPNTSSSIGPQGINFNITIDYTVLMWERKLLPMS